MKRDHFHSKRKTTPPPQCFLIFVNRVGGKLAGKIFNLVIFENKTCKTTIQDVLNYNIASPKKLPSHFYVKTQIEIFNSVVKVPEQTSFFILQTGIAKDMLIILAIDPSRVRSRNKIATISEGLRGRSPKDCKSSGSPARILILIPVESV